MRSAERAHYGLAVHCARRFQDRGVDMEELISEAEAALLFAASRFDETRGVRFSTYAIPVVLGALRDRCRRETPMHIPRDDLKVLSAASAAQERLTQRDGREPDVAALAGELGMEPQKLSQILAAKERMHSSAQEAVEGSFEDRVLLRDALNRLQAPYKQVLWLRYGLGVTQAEIARKFGVGQPQVSRWEQKGLQWMREGLRIM